MNSSPNCAVHCGNHRLVALQYGRGCWRRTRLGIAQTGDGGISLFAEHDLLHVVPRAERAPVAGEDHATHFWIAVRITKRLLQLCVHLAVEGVHDFGAVEGDDGHMVVEPIVDKFGHPTAP